jgi:ABC-2 type transport system ATP-binding protein
MIKIENISKKFGKKVALSDINLSLNQGEVIALIGENGAGKSTLMRIMCGFLSPQHGKVSVGGYDIDTNRLDALSYIGYVPELSVLYGDMLVYDFLLWIAQIWNIKDYKKAIIEASKQMNIINVLNEKIDSLSKGYKKRVEIASAILHKPKFLILDEPTDGLDPNQKYDIRIFIKNYAKKNTVLVSTHVLEDASIADRVIMMSAGKIIKDTTISEFKKVSNSDNLSEAFRILSTKEKDEK